MKGWTEPRQRGASSPWMRRTSCSSMPSSRASSTSARKTTRWISGRRSRRRNRRSPTLRRWTAPIDPHCRLALPRRSVFQCPPKSSISKGIHRTLQSQLPAVSEAIRADQSFLDSQKCHRFACFGPVLGHQGRHSELVFLLASRVGDWNRVWIRIRSLWCIHGRNTVHDPVLIAVHRCTKWDFSPQFVPPIKSRISAHLLILNKLIKKNYTYKKIFEENRGTLVLAAALVAVYQCNLPAILREFLSFRRGISLRLNSEWFDTFR